VEVEREVLDLVVGVKVTNEKLKMALSVVFYMRLIQMLIIRSKK